MVESKSKCLFCNESYTLRKPYDSGYCHVKCKFAQQKVDRLKKAKDKREERKIEKVCEYCKRPVLEDLNKKKIFAHEKCRQDEIARLKVEKWKKS